MTIRIDDHQCVVGRLTMDESENAVDQCCCVDGRCIDECCEEGECCCDD